MRSNTLRLIVPASPMAPTMAKRITMLISKVMMMLNSTSIPARCCEMVCTARKVQACVGECGLQGFSHLGAIGRVVAPGSD